MYSMMQRTEPKQSCETLDDDGGYGVSPPSSTLQFTEPEFRAFLLQLSKQTGNKAELAPRLGVSAQFLGDVIAGRKRAGPKLLEGLGATMTRVYIVPIEADV